MPLHQRTQVWHISLAALLTLALGCTKPSAGGTGASTGATATPTQLPIRLLDLDGKPFDLLPDGQNRITVVVFTRTDCPISNRAAPEVCRLCELYQPRGVDFYLIYVDPHEQPDDIRRHLREYGYPCPGLRDPGHALVAYCQAIATPEAVVFNQERKIAYQGRINDQYVELGTPRPEPTTNDLAKAIESTVLGQSVATPRTRPVGCSIADLKQ
jgi:AhpC/TSA family protein